MKTITLLFMAIIMATGVLAFTGGDGTDGNPFQISDCTELQAMNGSNHSYLLLNDIDCSDTVNWNSGQGWNPIAANEIYRTFRLDGEGYTISDLFCNRTDTCAFINGSYPADGDYSWLHNLSIIRSYSESPSKVGIVSADVTRNLLVENVYVSGEIHVPYPESNAAAGAFGYFLTCVYSDYDHCKIEQVGIDINITADGNYSSLNIGGLVTILGSGYTVKDSYIIGNIIAENTSVNTGGISSGVAPLCASVLSAPYLVHNVLMGMNIYPTNWDSATDIMTEYYNGVDHTYTMYEIRALNNTANYVNVSNYDDLGGGSFINLTGRPCGYGNCTNDTIFVMTDTELKTDSTYSTWNTTIWDIQDGQYPQLKWLNVTPSEAPNLTATINITSPIDSDSFSLNDTTNVTVNITIDYNRTGCNLSRSSSVIQTFSLFNNTVNQVSYDPIHGFNNIEVDCNNSFADSVNFYVCIPSWSCSSYGTCSNVTLPCESVNDGNSCGLSFNGNLSDYDGSCSPSSGGSGGGSFPDQNDTIPAELEATVPLLSGEWSFSNWLGGITGFAALEASGLQEATTIRFEQNYSDWISLFYYILGMAIALGIFSFLGANKGSFKKGIPNPLSITASVYLVVIALLVNLYVRMNPAMIVLTTTLVVGTMGYFSLAKSQKVMKASYRLMIALAFVIEVIALYILK